MQGCRDAWQDAADSPRDGVFNARGMSRFQDLRVTVIADRQKDIIILDEKNLSADEVMAVSPRRPTQKPADRHAVSATHRAPRSSELHTRARGPLV